MLVIEVTLRHVETGQAVLNWISDAFQPSRWEASLGGPIIDVQSQRALYGITVTPEVDILG